MQVGTLTTKISVKKILFLEMCSVVNNIFFYNSNQSVIHLRTASVWGKLFHKERVRNIIYAEITFGNRDQRQNLWILWTKIKIDFFFYLPSPPTPRQWWHRKTFFINHLDLHSFHRRWVRSIWGKIYFTSTILLLTTHNWGQWEKN